MCAAATLHTAAGIEWVCDSAAACPLAAPPRPTRRFNNGRFYLLVDGDMGVVGAAARPHARPPALLCWHCQLRWQLSSAMATYCLQATARMHA